MTETDAKPGQSAAWGSWFVLGAAMLWGTAGTAQSFAPHGFDPLIVGACRLAVGGVALMLLVLHRGEIESPANWPWSRVLLAAVFTAGYQLCFFAAVVRAGVAVGTIVGMGSSPIAAGILTYLIYKDKPDRRWCVATTLAIIGCTFLGLAGGDPHVQIDPTGLLLAICAGSAYAVSTMAIKDLLKNYSPNFVMAVVICTAALLLMPLFFFRPIAWLTQPAGLAVVLHLGLFTMALSYWLFARGLSRIPAATALTLSLAEPLTAGILGVIVVKEHLSLTGMYGLSLIFCGLLILSVRRRR